MDLRNTARLARVIGIPALAVALTAVAACGAGGGNDPNIDPYLQRVDELGGVPDLDRNFVIAAGQRYCEVKWDHKDEPQDAGRAAAAQQVSQDYNLNGPQLDAVAEAANDVLCPNY